MVRFGPNLAPQVGSKIGPRRAQDGSQERSNLRRNLDTKIVGKGPRGVVGVGGEGKAFLPRECRGVWGGRSPPSEWLIG